MKAMYCLEENQCIGRLLDCMVYYDKIIKKLNINSNQGLDWKYYTKGKNKTMNDMKTKHYNNKEAIIFLKKKMFYVYRLFHTRDRWAFYARMDINKFSKDAVKKFVSYNKKQNHKTLKLKLLTWNFEIFKEKLISQYDMNKEFERFDEYKVKGSNKVYKDDSIITSSKEIENIVMMINSFFTINASGNMDRYLKYGQLEIHNLSNIAIFSNKINKYFEMIESEVIGGVNSIRVQSIMSKNGFSEGIARYSDMILDDRIHESPDKRVRIDKARTVDKDD